MCDQIEDWYEVCEFCQRRIEQKIETKNQKSHKQVKQEEESDEAVC